MNITPCFLCAENSSGLAETTVGTVLKESESDLLWSERASAIDTIIIHYMSDSLRNPESPYVKEKLISIFIEYGVSAHYLILRSGEILQLVPEDKKAWHAGGSIMPDGRIAANDFSIGIELAGSGDEEFTEFQYRSLYDLISDIKSKHRIKFILGHEDISGETAVSKGLRTDIKTDPGIFFKWERIGGRLY